MESKVNSPEEAAEKRASDLGDDREQAGTAGIVGIDVLASEKILDVLTSEEFLDLTPVVVVATKETTENGANDLRDEREETGAASVVEVNVLAGLWKKGDQALLTQRGRGAKFLHDTESFSENKKRYHNLSLTVDERTEILHILDIIV